MVFGSNTQRPRGWVVLTGALGALVLGITTASAAIPGDGFHVRATNSADANFWGIYPKLPAAGEGPGLPEETPTPEPTPDPTVEPTPDPTPEPTVPPEPDNMVFTINLAVAGCTTTARNFAIYGVKTDDVKLISPTGKETVLRKTTGAQPTTVPTDETGKWHLDGEYERISFTGNNCLTEVNRWQGAYVKSARVAFQNTKNLRTVEEVPTQITDMGSMLAGSGFNGDVSGWKTSKVTDMTGMFSSAAKFEGKGIEHFDMGNVVNASTMFQSATIFDADLSEWDVRKLENTTAMFQNTTRFQGTGMEHWETEGLRIIVSMFLGATAFDADIGSWDVSKVTDFTTVFTSASAYTGKGIERWDVSNATTMNGMFRAAVKFNGQIGEWGPKVAKTRDISTMLQAALEFDQDLSGWQLCSGVTRNLWATNSKIASKTAMHPDFNRVCSA